MGLFDRLRGPGKETGVFVNDPRFDDWEVLRQFEDVDSARSWCGHLTEAGVDAVVTADHPLDRFGRGDLYVQVPGDQYGDAEAFLSNWDLDDD